MRFLLLVLKNLRRNVVRTAVTGSALVVLGVVAILIGAVFSSLDRLTSTSARNFKMVVRSRWRIPSLMPLAYLEPLSRGAASQRSVGYSQAKAVARVGHIDSADKTMFVARVGIYERGDVGRKKRFSHRVKLSW
jgi:hypothetical protein